MAWALTNTASATWVPGTATAAWTPTALPAIPSGTGGCCIVMKTSGASNVGTPNVTALSTTAYGLDITAGSSGHIYAIVGHSIIA